MEQGKGLRLGNTGKGSTNFQFASSNPIWRASLDIFDIVNKMYKFKAYLSVNALWTNKTIDRYLSIYLLSSDLLRKKIADAKKIRGVLRLFTRCCSSFSLMLRIVLLL